MPRCLDTLFTVAHEFGHHESADQHDEVGRVLDGDQTPDSLFEEVRAWRLAGDRLQRLGLRGGTIWAEFFVEAHQALASNAFDFEAYFWLTEKLKRMKTRCPTCGSRALSVLGEESRADCAIACRACGVRTKPRRTMAALSTYVRGTRFTGLCHCGGR